jgi:hypothetical protein
MGKQYNDYYTYAYLREDKTPYYIGKGRGKRIYSKNRAIKPPKDKSRILFLKKNLTEAEAFKHEVYMIFVLGRKNLGTGILRNLTNGGEGTSGHIKSEKCKKKIGEAHIGKTHTEEWKKAISEKLSGRTHTEEAKKKMSVAKSGENHPLFGVPGKTGALNPRSKAIIVIELDGTQRHYGGIRETARDLIIDRSSLCRYLKTGHVLTQGPRKGWQFLFKNSENF